MIKSSNSNNNITTPDKIEEDHLNEQNLRPLSFNDFIGQKKEIEKLKVYIEAAHKRNESLDHVILYGPPGLGKTTLAYIISKELKSKISYETDSDVKDKTVMYANIQKTKKYFNWYPKLSINSGIRKVINEKN